MRRVEEPKSALHLVYCFLCLYYGMAFCTLPSNRFGRPIANE